MRLFISFNKFIGLFSAALLAASSGTGVVAQPPDAKSELAANAAVQYWQAFAQMPTLDKEQEKILGDWNTVDTSDPAVQKLAQASQASRMYLHRGAKLARCDWGLDYSDGISLMLPHLAKARDLARHAALHARCEFDRGNRRPMQEDSTAIMALARHVGRDPILISILVRYLIEDTAVDLVSPYIPQMKAPYEKIVAAYKALPQAATVQETLPIEKKYMAGYVITELARVEKQKPGSWREHWQHMLGPDAPDSVKEIATFEEAIRLTEKLLPVYDQLEKFFALSEKEFDASYAQFKQKTNAANPLAGILLPSLDKVRARERRNQVRLAMLMAAVAVVNDGPEKLKEIPDPVVGGPFEYRKLDGGFELKSKFTFEDKPVTLSIGARPKP
jgi:hypothetical protein